MTFEGETQESNAMTTAQQRRTNSNAETESGSDSPVTGYDSKLWRMADALRGNMDNRQERAR